MPRAKPMISIIAGVIVAACSTPPQSATSSVADPAALADAFKAAAPASAEPDLVFPTAASRFEYAHGTILFKPDGAGPFPALVVLPDCGGQARHDFDWAKEALARGYVVLVVDPFGPRGVGQNCTPPNAVGINRLLKDALDAGHHLQKQPFVDPARVGFIGFSLGAMAGLGAAGEESATASGDPFKAIVSLYPICAFANVKIAATNTVLSGRMVPDRVSVPLLVEVGDRDTEAPAADCLALIAAHEAKGEPVASVVYHATHEWDSSDKNGSRKYGLNGQNVIYLYDASVTEQSRTDAFDFLARHLR